VLHDEEEDDIPKNMEVSNTFEVRAAE